MRWNVLVVFMLVALGSPAVSEAAGEQILILGGGKTAEDSEAWVKRWQSIEPVIKDFISLPAGYPKRAESKDIPGLNPGFHILVLGYCGAGEVDSRLDLLKALYPGAYARPVKNPVPGQCPELVKRAELVDSQSVKKDKWRLVVLRASLRPGGGAIARRLGTALGWEIPWMTRSSPRGASSGSSR